MFDDLNKEKRKYERGIRTGFITTGLAFILFIPVMMSLGPFGFPLIAVPFLGGAIYAGTQIKKISNMSMSFKENFLPKILEEMIPGCTYKMHDGFTEKQVIYSGLLRNQDRFYSEDLIYGEYKGVSFKCSDVKQQDVSRDSKGRTHTTTVFDGRFYEFDFPKQFKSNLKIVQPALINLGFNFNRVEMESIEFNSELSVYSDNPHDAFYVLTPHFMERVLYLDKKYQNAIRLAIQDSKLFITLATGNAFDFKVFKTLDESIFDEYRQEFKDIMNFVNLLNLDSTLFKGSN